MLNFYNLCIFLLGDIKERQGSFQCHPTWNLLSEQHGREHHWQAVMLSMKRHESLKAWYNLFSASKILLYCTVQCETDKFQIVTHIYAAVQRQKTVTSKSPGETKAEHQLRLFHFFGTLILSYSVLPLFSCLSKWSYGYGLELYSVLPFFLLSIKVCHS